MSLVNNTYQTNAEKSYIIILFFLKDVLLFVFALVTADTKGNSQPILKIALLTTSFI